MVREVKRLEHKLHSHLFNESHGMDYYLIFLHKEVRLKINNIEMSGVNCTFQLGIKPRQFEAV